MSHSNAALCLFDQYIFFHHQFLYAEWSNQLFKNFHQRFLQWLWHHPQHNFGWYFPQLKSLLSIFGKWVHHQSRHERGGKKPKKMLNGIFESCLQDVNTVVCRATSAQPPSLPALHPSSHPTPSPGSRFPWILPAALSSLHLPDSQHALCVWLAPTWSPPRRSSQSLAAK